MKLYCYHIAPIDSWLGAFTEEQIDAAAYANRERHKPEWAREEIARLKSRAEAAFLTIGWEGDVREGPYYFAVPGDAQMHLGYVLKQDNNGNCFVASPVPLPAEHLSIFERTVIDDD